VELYWLYQSCFYIVLSSFEWDQESVTRWKGHQDDYDHPLDEALISSNSIGVKGKLTERSTAVLAPTACMAK
jgi:hypothetical protein